VPRNISKGYRNNYRLGKCYHLVNNEDLLFLPSKIIPYLLYLLKEFAIFNYTADLIYMEMTKIFWNHADLVRASKEIDCFTYTQRNMQIIDSFEDIQDYSITDVPHFQNEKRKAEAIKRFVQGRSGVYNYAEGSEEGPGGPRVYQEDEKESSLDRSILDKR